MNLVQRTDGKELDAVACLTLSVKNAISSFEPSTDDSQMSDFDLNVIQIEVEGEQQVLTGRVRRKRLNPSTKPPGQWLENWVDTIHEADGHCIDGQPGDRGGEHLLANGMFALYAQAEFLLGTPAGLLARDLVQALLGEAK